MESLPLAIKVCDLLLASQVIILPIKTCLQAPFMDARASICNITTAFSGNHYGKGAAGMQGVQKMNGVEWVVVWDTCSLMRDHWVGYQVPGIPSAL